jgi:NAD(P)H-dependent FMN reductase
MKFVLLNFSFVSKGFVCKMKILAITSSIARASKVNQIVTILQSVQLPRNVIVEAAHIDMPLFNADPEPTQMDKIIKFRTQLQDSKAVLFVASEMPLGYFYSITAPLLNATSWGTVR